MRGFSTIPAKEGRLAEMAERSFGSVACGPVRLAEIGGKRPSPWSGLGPGFAGAGLFRLFGFSAIAARSNASNISRLRASMPVISKRLSFVIGSAGLSQNLGAGGKVVGLVRSSDWAALVWPVRHAAC